MKKNDIEKFYRYDENYLEMLRSHDQVYLRGYIDFLIKNIPKLKGKKIIELGCGTGLALQNFKDSFTVGLDISHNAIRALDLDGIFVIGNAVRLPFKEGVFDVICSNGLLESITDISNFMGESVRVLRKGGLFLIMAPDLLSPITTVLRVLRYLLAGRIFPTFVENISDVIIHPWHFFYLWSKKMISNDATPLFRNPRLQGPAGLDADAPYLTSVLDVRREMKEKGLVGIQCSNNLAPTIRCRGEKA